MEVVKRSITVISVNSQPKSERRTDHVGPTTQGIRRRVRHRAGMTLRLESAGEGLGESARRAEARRGLGPRRTGDDAWTQCPLRHRNN